MDFAAVRAALKTNLEAGLGTTDYQISCYQLGQPTPPAFEISPVETTYDVAMGRGADSHEWVVRAFVAMSTDRGAQERVDLLMAPGSVKAAIESDCTLAGQVDDLRVTGVRGPIQWQREGGVVLGAEWTVELTAAGT